jgi:hypothetical protein
MMPSIFRRLRAQRVERKAAGAINRTQAVAEAIRRGLIS